MNSADSRLPEYLDNMMEATRLACSYVEGMQRSDFMADKRTQQAVIMNLLVIGEVATKLLKDHQAFTDRHANVPWTGMKGMRNRIAHGYFDINIEVVWETVHTALPELLAQLPAVRRDADRSV
jgi:uncharacterized protein with HEPN domain